MGAEKIQSWQEVADNIESLRKGSAASLKVVFTNGCFDILHAGHVAYLADAAALGDALVIGLNSDESVSSIKPGRPIVQQSGRAAVLAALESVDFVTMFDDDTPYELIKFIQPDILVKGGDWQRDDIVGHDLVADTQSLPFVEGMSTSNIIERIVELCNEDMIQSDTEKWEDVFVTYDPMEVEMVKGLLQSGGINVRLSSAKVGPYPVNVGRMGEVKLFVRKSDLESAQKLLEQFQ